MRPAFLFMAVQLVLILLPSAVFAQSSAKELADWCRPLRDVRPQGRNATVPQDFRAGYCVGVFRAMQFMGREFGPSRTSGSRAQGFCPGADVTQFDLIRTFIAFVDADTSLDARPALAVARQALSRSYPCSTQQF